MPSRTTLLAAALALAVGVPAASAQSVKIGTFDPNKILSGSKLGQQLQDDMNQYRVGKEAEIKKQKDDFDKRVEQYKAAAPSMSQEHREQEEQDLANRQRDLERVMQDVQDELQRRRQKAIHQLEEQVSKVLEDYGRKNGYTLILQSDLCAFSLPSIDVSDEIIKLVDQMPAGAKPAGTAAGKPAAPGGH